MSCITRAQVEALINAAVAASAGYTITGLYSGSSTPIDSATLYIGPDSGAVSLTPTYALAAIQIIKAGTIKSAWYMAKMGNVPSAENVAISLRHNDTTDFLISNAPWVSGFNAALHNINQPVAVGDTISLKMVTPAWVTNPSLFRLYWYVFIE